MSGTWHRIRTFLYGNSQLRQHSNVLWPEDAGFCKKGPSYVFGRDPITHLKTLAQHFCGTENLGNLWYGQTGYE